MNFETELILSKIQGSFVCVFAGEQREYLSFKELEKEDVSSQYRIESIGIREGKLTVNLKKCSNHAAELDFEEAWVKRYKNDFGQDPSFF